MAEALKDALNGDYLLSLGREIKRYQTNFSATRFKKDCLSNDWEDLSLKERTSRITVTLNKHLDGTYKQQINTLKKVAPQFTGYKAFYFPEFVSTFGLSAKDRKVSYDAMKVFTRYSSSEFAIRFFILEDPKETMRWMLSLASSSQEDERRLASEGCRPRLPWSFKLQNFIDDPSPLFPIFEKLVNDSSLYVRRSVANNLNDISKDHPKKVLAWLKKVLSKKETPEVRWVAQQALRTLLKKGDKEALKLMGFSQKPPVKVSQFKLSSSQVKMSERLEFSITLENTSNQDVPLLVDFIFHFKKKKGVVNPKVFRWKKFILAPKEKKTLSKRHLFQDLTTREHHHGEQLLQVQYNGILTEAKKFHLIKK